MLSFKQMLVKLNETTNSASAQGLGLQDTTSTGKAPGKTAKAVKTNPKYHEPMNHSDMKYVSDNLKYTKVIDKQTKTRVANHHNHK